MTSTSLARKPVRAGKAAPRLPERLSAREGHRADGEAGSGDIDLGTERRGMERTKEREREREGEGERTEQLESWCFWHGYLVYFFPGP